MIDAIALHPVVLGVGSAALAALLLSRCASPGGRSAKLFASIHRLWRRTAFILPSNPSDLVWLLVGYLLPRVLFPATTGSGLPGWNFDPLESRQPSAQVLAAARESAAGTEVCAYSWGMPQGLVGSEAAVRSCADISMLLLVITGLVCPAVEFARVLVLQCTRLHSAPTSSTPAATAAASAPSKDKKKSTAIPPASAAAAAPAEQSEQSVDPPLYQRVVHLANLFLLSAGACWLLLTFSFAVSSSSASVHDGSDSFSSLSASACPVPWGMGGSGVYGVEEALLRSFAGGGRGCPAQWLQVRTAHTMLALVCAVLATASAVMLRPVPLSLRLPLFTALCLSLVKGVLPMSGAPPALLACVVVAMRCMA